MPGLFELNAVAAIATRGSFRAAAAELGVSPSALSHAISGLEKSLGVRLFHRTTRSVSLSDAGAKFLERVRPALREISAAMESVNDYRDTPVGTLRINASRSAARHVLLPVVLEFLRRYPDMKVEIATDDRLVDIVADGFDAGVRHPSGISQDMVAVPIGPRVGFAVVASPKYLRGKPPVRRPADLHQHDCILYRMTNGALLDWEFARAGKEEVVKVKGSLTVTDDDLVKEAALRGAGVAYTGEWSVTADLEAGRLVRLLEPWTPSYSGLCLYYPAHRNVAAGLKAFVGLLRELRKK